MASADLYTDKPGPGWKNGLQGRGWPLRLVCGLLALAGLVPAPGLAQVPEPDEGVPAAEATTPPVDWRLRLDGQAVGWPLAAALPLDSLVPAVRRVVEVVRQDGYYFAELDTVRVDTSAAHPVVLLFVSRGPRVLVGAVRLEGIEALDSLALRRLFDTRPGRVLDPARFEADLAALLDRYEQAGYPLAEARVTETRLTPEDPPRLLLTVRVTENQPVNLEAFELVGATRTADQFAARVAGVRTGAPLRFDPEAIRRHLEHADLFEEVGEPVLVLSPGGQAVIRVPIEESAPGAFDLVLGYQPPSGTGRRGALVGNGHLLLRNVFGRGKLFGLKLSRLPGQVSSVDVRGADPYLFGLPLRLEMRFEGYQQDSLYGQRQVRLETGYRILGELEAYVTASRAVTRPGVAGLRAGERPEVPRSDSWFTGLGVRYRRVDRPENPRRGIGLLSSLETGRKAREGLAGDGPTEEATALRQRRLRFESRVYAPLWNRQVLALGLDAAVLASSRYDESDLFRFGGATTLRGYEENAWSGSAVARGLLEWRLQLDRTSFAFLFSDLGAVRLESVPRRWRVLPGYGFGLQYDTSLGLVTISYALNPDDGFAGGKIHAGLTFGL